MAFQYILGTNLDRDIETAQAAEQEQIRLNLILGNEASNLAKNRVPLYPLPTYPYTNDTNLLLHGILYGGENVGGQIITHAADERQAFVLPERVVRYAIIYPEHSQADTVKVAEYGHLVDVYASDADRPKIPIYGREPIRISGGKNLLSFGITTLEASAKFNVLFFS